MNEEEHPELFSSPGPAGTPVAGTACLGIPDGGIYMIYIYIYMRYTHESERDIYMIYMIYIYIYDTDLNTALVGAINFALHTANHIAVILT